MKNNEMLTYTGKVIDPLNATVDDIEIVDIAHALSNICRFNGHCRKFYSVAQHSVLVSVHVQRQYAMYGLLHDASEAYLGDVIRPIKESDTFKYYRIVEHNLTKVIFEKFGLKHEMPPNVSLIDGRLLLAEARDLGLDFTHIGIEPLETIVHPTNPEEAEMAFLDWFKIIVEWD